MNLASFKKHLVLTICAAVALVALVVIGLKLYTSTRRYNVEKRELKAIVEHKEQLDHRSPYPSLENVQRETENYKEILDNYNELNEKLRARQIEPQAMQSVVFMALLEKSLRQIGRQLSAARVAYPSNYKFSFESYAAGKPPAQKNVPRLVQQLKIIESLCCALAEAGIAELVSIRREEFESGPEARGPAAAAPRSLENAGDNALYTTQHFSLALKAAEPAAIKFLDLMARYPIFTVVTSLEMVNLKLSPQPDASSGASKEGLAVAKPSVNRERVEIIGDELVELKLELDVNRFAPSLDFMENAKQQ